MLSRWAGQCQCHPGGGQGAMRCSVGTLKWQGRESKWWDDSHLKRLFWCCRTYSSGAGGGGTGWLQIQDPGAVVTDVVPLKDLMNILWVWCWNVQLFELHLEQQSNISSQPSEVTVGNYWELIEKNIRVLSGSRALKKLYETEVERFLKMRQIVLRWTTEVRPQPDVQFDKRRKEAVEDI